MVYGDKKVIITAVDRKRMFYYRSSGMAITTLSKRFRIGLGRVREELKIELKRRSLVEKRSPDKGESEGSIPSVATKFKKGKNESTLDRR